MKLLSFVAVICSVVILSSCQKDDTANPPAAKTKTELISASAWKYNDAKIDTDNNGTGDQPIPAGVVEACTTDNTIVFASNGNGTVDEGPSKCDPADPQSFPFTWNFTSTETVLNFSSSLFAGIGGDFKIISLTDTELILSKSLTVPPIPLPFTVVISFKH